MKERINFLFRNQRLNLTIISFQINVDVNKMNKRFMNVSGCLTGEQNENYGNRQFNRNYSLEKQNREISKRRYN
mgnify:CR=1 FL=1